MSAHDNDDTAPEAMVLHFNVYSGPDGMMTIGEVQINAPAPNPEDDTVKPDGFSWEYDATMSYKPGLLAQINITLLTGLSLMLPESGAGLGDLPVLDEDGDADALMRKLEKFSSRLAQRVEWSQTVLKIAVMSWLEGQWGEGTPTVVIEEDP